MSGGEPEGSGPKTYVSRAVSWSRKKTSGARSGRPRSGERRSQKWALTRSGMLCAGVIEESMLRKSQPASYIFVYSHKVQSDSTAIRQLNLLGYCKTKKKERQKIPDCPMSISTVVTVHSNLQTIITRKPCCRKETARYSSYCCDLNFANIPASFKSSQAPKAIALEL